MGNEWAVHVVWAGSCGLPLTIFVFSLFERVCTLSFKFQICKKKLNLFDMINFDLKTIRNSLDQFKWLGNKSRCVVQEANKQ